MNKNVHFFTYAKKCIDNEILYFLRENKKTLSNYSLEYVLNETDEGSVVTLEDCLLADTIIEVDYEKEEIKKLKLIYEVLVWFVINYGSENYSLFLENLLEEEKEIFKKYLRKSKLITNNDLKSNKSMMINFSDIEEKGPIRTEWKNFSDLGKNKYHCHLNYSYVACWYYDKKADAYLVEVTYAGSRENAPY
ncbi:hypothetical protein [uncultured Treponema sp.]|uniref:hypothetical protein n=1 Tax=uncultured Treponema sp. TaxID=162155 RepID=UPI00258E5106|nr:hypothetical protein [uncultured Treponema sp.]